MAFITDQCIEDIRAKVDLVDLASPYVMLKRSGTIYKGLSPFNPEKTPSFVIYPNSQIFKCFSSGHAGDLFRFIQLIENLNFPESIEWIAERYKIPLEYEKGGRSDAKDRSERKRLLDIHVDATDYYHSLFLSKNENGIFIQKYWQDNRKFSLEIAKEIRIGFSEPIEDGLLDFLLQKGHIGEDLIKSGLYYGKVGQKLFPRFTGRLMIPIRDIQGRIIAFTARKTDLTPDSISSDAKYINSPETPLFHKSKILFGLNHARNFIESTSSFLLVEGQLDVLRCWSKGFHTAVAPQGTSVTEEQLTLLKRYSPTYVECLLDGDAAGLKAALRVLPIAFSVGLDIRFTTLSPGDDPDSLLLNSGETGLDQIPNRAMDPIEFLVQQRVGGEALSAGELENLSLELFSFLIRLESEIKKSEYLKVFAQLLNLDIESVKSDFQRFSGNAKYNRRISAPTNIDENTENLAKKVSRELTTVEYVILFLLLHHEELQEHMAQVVNPEWINLSSIHGRVLHRILLEMQEGLWAGIKEIDNLLETEEEKDVFYSILAEPPSYEEPIDKANQCLRDLFGRYLKQQEGLLKKKMESVSQADHQEQLKIMGELNDLRKMKKTPPIIEFHIQN